MDNTATFSDANDRDFIICPECKNEIEYGSEGFDCDDCERIYNICDRRQCRSAKLASFVSACVDDEGLLNAPRMMQCGAPDGNGRVMIVNIMPGLPYANCGPVFDGVTFKWLCPDCGETWETESD